MYCPLLSQAHCSTPKHLAPVPAGSPSPLAKSLAMTCAAWSMRLTRLGKRHRCFVSVSYLCPAVAARGRKDRVSPTPSPIVTTRAQDLEELRALQKTGREKDGKIAWLVVCLSGDWQLRQTGSLLHEHMILSTLPGAFYFVYSLIPSVILCHRIKIEDHSCLVLSLHFNSRGRASKAPGVSVRDAALECP